MLILVLGGSASAVAGVESSPTRATAVERADLVAAEGIYPSHTDRFGFGVMPDYGTPADYDVARLHGGWYVDWGVQFAPSHPAGLDYAQMVTTYADSYTPDAETLVAIARANPGALWLVGNEPDCIYQGNSTPEQYARLYHEIYVLLKAHDPDSQVAIGGIVQATPLRLQWLDAVLERYQALYGQEIPVDVWNIHAFLLNEERDGWGCEIPPGIDADYGELRGIDDHDRMDLFAEQIVRFRAWMADHGERNKPLIVSEYGILMVYGDGFDWPRVETFMLRTFEYFMNAVDPELGYPADENRLVQRWSWYSLNDKAFEGYNVVSYLFDRFTYEISPLGIDFQNYTATLYTPYVDLEVAQLRVAPAAPYAPPGQTTPVTLIAVIRNGGNTDVQNVSVQFWAGDPSQPIGDVQRISASAARTLNSVSVEWPAVPAGVYLVGVTIDGEGRHPESDEQNNQRTRTLLVAGHRDLLPLAFQGH